MQAYCIKIRLRKCNIYILSTNFFCKNLNEAYKLKFIKKVTKKKQHYLVLGDNYTVILIT